MRIAALAEHHDRAGFDCGDAELNRWLQQLARQHRDKGLSSTFVAVDGESAAAIHGYYALSVAELVNIDLPAKLAKRLPRRVPVFRLGRLAVSRQWQGRRIGELLLFDAIARCSRAAGEVGGVGLVVNAKATAVGFYAQYGFEAMADHPANLFLALQPASAH